MEWLTSPLFFQIWFFVLGLAIGSFLNVVIYRLPRGYLLLLPRRSFCRSCHHQVSWFENIPLISYLVLKGRCRVCKTKISGRYPLVEFLTAVMFVATYNVFGLKPEVFIYSSFCAALIAVTFIDIDFRIIPDSISLGGTVVGLVISFWLQTIPFIDAVIGVLAGAGFFWALSFFYEKIAKREGLGFGDVKLMAMIGAFLGLKGTLVTIIVSSIIGSIFGVAIMAVQKKDLKMALPYGPFLALGALIALFWSDYFLFNPYL